MKRLLLVLASIISLSSSNLVKAEEGGAGQYLPGAFSSAVDISPNLPGFAVATDFLFYGGDFSASRTLPVAGRLVAGLNANVYLGTSPSPTPSSLKSSELITRWGFPFPTSG